MDQLLKQKMDTMEGQFSDMGEKLDQMYYALLGNELTKDGGLIGRIIQLEKDVAVLEQKTETLERERNKSDIYVNILWAAGGVICTGIIGYILSVVLHLK